MRTVLYIGGPFDGTEEATTSSHSKTSFISRGHVSSRGTERSWYYIDPATAGKDVEVFHYSPEKSHTIEGKFH